MSPLFAEPDGAAVPYVILRTAPDPNLPRIQYSRDESLVLNLPFQYAITLKADIFFQSLPAKVVRSLRLKLPFATLSLVRA